MKTNVDFPVIRFTFIAMLLVRALQLTAQHPILGTTDINAYIKEAPGLPANTADAAKRAYGANPLQPDPASMDYFYQPFEDKVNSRIGDYQRFAKEKMSNASTSQADYEQQAISMANSNPIVAGMGGYDNISKMSEAERKAAAQKAAEAYMANPQAAHGGMQSAGMAAMQQKIMSDPEYRKKFEKMSEAEKEAELRKYMAKDQPMTMSPDQMKAREQRIASEQTQADRVRNSQEVQLKISELQQKLSEVGQWLGDKLADIRQQGNDNHDAISKEISARYKAIPMVELGEYGHDHDPEQVRTLRIEEAKRHQERAQAELKLNTSAFAEAADRYQSVVSEYLDFLKGSYGKIYGGVSPKDMMEGTNTEQPLVAFEAGLVGIALEMSKKSRELTSEAAQWEANYVQVTQSFQAGK